MASDDDIASRLHTWALQEMHFHPQGRHVNTPLPNASQFKQIFRGPSADFWKFVLSRVRSAQTVKKVKGNLGLKRHADKSYKVKYKTGNKFDEEKENLLEQRNKLTGEVTSLFTDINHLENDFKRLEQEVVEAETRYQTSCNEISILRRQRALVQTYSLQTNDTAKHYEEYTKKITTQADKLLNKAKKGSEYYSRKRSSTDDDHYSSSLETRQGKQVRETCEAIGSFLQKMLQGEFGTDKTVFQSKKDIIWKSVEELLSEFSVTQILNALVTNTQESAFTLRDMTSKVDIRRDAEKLRFKYERTGQLRDESNPPNILQSVHQLLEENQVNQIKRFVETEKFCNETWKLEQRFAEVKEEIDTKLQFVFKNHKDLKLARELIECDIDLVGRKAILASLNCEANNLRELISKSLKDKDIICAKFQRIQDFKQIVERKQNLIQVLARQNYNAKSRLEDQRKEIDQYINKSLSTHFTETQSLTIGLHGSVVDEIDKFTALALPNLLFTVVNESALKTPISDISINQTTNPSYQQLQQLLDTVQFPPYKAPECILLHCLKMKYEDTLKKINWSDEDISSSEIEELCRNVHEHDQKLLDKMLPLLNQRINSTGKALADCVHVKDTISEWWNQPAQYVVPWVKVEGNSLQNWKEKGFTAITVISEEKMKIGNCKRH
ncbi:HAUS augmin-like complex subunit 5 isoform X1 [Mytilus californianus]|uniref:HAUS augmin-like complex subunit 5 isoform X1 n=2 Tax=Mytilus californianus TaxID=6549 RepID=UPI00224753CD|nr:HAUS augmin-like complex subunit 5 isoform X1 [Mytilus californianus]